MLGSLASFTTVKYELTTLAIEKYTPRQPDFRQDDEEDRDELMTEDLTYALHMRLCIINNIKIFSLSFRRTNGRHEGYLTTTPKCQTYAYVIIRKL